MIATTTEMAIATEIAGSVLPVLQIPHVQSPQRHSSTVHGIPATAFRCSRVLRRVANRLGGMAVEYHRPFGDTSHVLTLLGDLLLGSRHHEYRLEPTAS